MYNAIIKFESDARIYMIYLYVYSLRNGAKRWLLQVRDIEIHGDTCTLFKEANSHQRLLMQATSESFRPRANWHQLRSAYTLERGSYYSAAPLYWIASSFRVIKSKFRLAVIPLLRIPIYIWNRFVRTF